MPDIEGFNEAAAKILTELYESFPKLSSISLESLGVDGGVAMGTFFFLHKEGFLHHQYSSGSAFMGVVLGSKGWLVLNGPANEFLSSAARGPEIDTDKSFGDRLRKAVDEGAKDVMSALTGQMLQVGVSAYLRGYGL